MKMLINCLKISRAIFFLTIIALCSCGSRLIADGYPNEMPKHNYVLSFYPNDNQLNPVYTITILEDSITAITNGPTRKGRRFYKGRLPVKTLLNLDILQKRIEERPFIRLNPNLNDTWSARLQIDGKKIYEDDEFGMKNLPNYNIKEIIEYIIKISGINVDFSIL